MIQHSRASGAVLAASTHYARTGNAAPIVDLAMLQNSTKYLLSRREQGGDVEDTSTCQIKDLTSIIL